MADDELQWTGAVRRSCKHLHPRDIDQLPWEIARSLIGMIKEFRGNSHINN